MALPLVAHGWLRPRLLEGFSRRLKSVPPSLRKTMTWS